MKILEQLRRFFCGKDKLIKPDVQVKRSPIHHYGVFATRDFSPQELIEECPVIVFCNSDTLYNEGLGKREFFLGR